jgi:hypothetical protein
VLQKYLFRLKLALVEEACSAQLLKELVEPVV